LVRHLLAKYPDLAWICLRVRPPRRHSLAFETPVPV
jgi:hypothetical protein